MKDEERRKIKRLKKAKIRELERELTCEIYEGIKGCLGREVSVDVPQKYRFVTWLVKRKFERKGYNCRVEVWRHRDYKDTLYVGW